MISSRGSPPGIHFLLANAYLTKGQFEEAIGHFESGLKIEPNNAEAVAAEGWAYFKWGRHEKALSYLRKALRIDERSSSAHYYLALIYEERGNYKGAMAELKKALAYDELGINTDRIKEAVRRIKDKLEGGQ